MTSRRIERRHLTPAEIESIWRRHHGDYLDEKPGLFRSWSGLLTTAFFVFVIAYFTWEFFR